MALDFYFFSLYCLSFCLFCFHQLLCILFKKIFFSFLRQGLRIPGWPLSHCVVEDWNSDSLASISWVLVWQAKRHSSGGGTGLNRGSVLTRNAATLVWATLSSWSLAPGPKKRLLWIAHLILAWFNFLKVCVRACTCAHVHASLHYWCGGQRRTFRNQFSPHWTWPFVFTSLCTSGSLAQAFPGLSASILP